MSYKEYFEQHAIFVEKMLQTSFVYLAVGITDKDIIFGWICGEEYGKSLLIHYIYTRKDLRKIGIATELLNYLLKGSQQWISTAITEDGFSFVKKRNGTFDTLNLLVR
jgi:GNAT superfamily N-acetyltransferase